MRSGWSDDEVDLSDNADPDSMVHRAHSSLVQSIAVQHASAPGNALTFTLEPDINRAGLRSDLSEKLSYSPSGAAERPSRPAAQDDLVSAGRQKSAGHISHPSRAADR